MSRPTRLLSGNTLYWTIRLYNDSQVLVDADSTPTVAVRKNGASVADAVTVTKRAATTGIYDCSYNPAGEAEGDQYTLEESATVSSTAYENNWSVVVEAVAFDSTTDTVDIGKISGSADSATRLGLSAEQIIPGTVDAAVAPTTTTFEADDITEATADHYNGRIVIFTSGSLAGQAASVTDYALVGGKGSFTVSAMTEAPSDNDTFILV